MSFVYISLKYRLLIAFLILGVFFLLAFAFVQMQLSQATSETNLQLVIFVPLIIAFFVGGIVGYIYIARFILAPIKELSSVAKQIKEGNLTLKAKSYHRDELGTLADVFNQMIERIRQSQFILEQKVQEKTTQLQTKIDEAARMNKLMVGRELKMIELKNALKKLEGQSQATEQTTVQQKVV